MLIRINPKVIVEVVYYNEQCMMVNQVAKELGIKTIEAKLLDETTVRLEPDELELLKEKENLTKKLNKLLSEKTGQSLEQIEKDIENDLKTFNII